MTTFCIISYPRKCTKAKASHCGFCFQFLKETHIFCPIHKCLCLFGFFVWPTKKHSDIFTSVQAPIAAHWYWCLMWFGGLLDVTTRSNAWWHKLFMCQHHTMFLCFFCHPPGWDELPYYILMFLLKTEAAGGTSSVVDASGSYISPFLMIIWPSECACLVYFGKYWAKREHQIFSNKYLFCCQREVNISGYGGQGHCWVVWFVQSTPGDARDMQHSPLVHHSLAFRA